MNEGVGRFIVHHAQIQLECSHQRVAQNFLGIQNPDVQQLVKHLLRKTAEVEEQDVTEVWVVCTFLDIGLFNVTPAEYLGDGVESTANKLPSFMHVHSYLEVCLFVWEVISLGSGTPLRFVLPARKELI